MNAQNLSSYIGDPVLLCPSSSILDSDGAISSNMLPGIPVGQWDGVLFIEICAGTDATDLHRFQITYTSLSTGSEGSDGASSAAGWTCSDALFKVGPHAAVGDINMVDFRIGQKEMSGGYLHVSLPACAETGTTAFATVLGIPYGGTGLLPSTNAFAVVVADHKSP